MVIINGKIWYGSICLSNYWLVPHLSLQIPSWLIPKMVQSLMPCRHCFKKNELVNICSPIQPRICGKQLYAGHARAQTCIHACVCVCLCLCVGGNGAKSKAFKNMYVYIYIILYKRCKTSICRADQWQLHLSNYGAFTSGFPEVLRRSFDGNNCKSFCRSSQTYTTENLSPSKTARARQQGLSNFHIQ